MITVFTVSLSVAGTSQNANNRAHPEERKAGADRLDQFWTNAQCREYVDGLLGGTSPLLTYGPSVCEHNVESTPCELLSSPSDFYTEK